MAKAPLEGLRVIDMTHSWAGPHATRRLADFGAEVIRVEYPGRLCMFRGGKTAEKAYDDFPAWMHLNRNKRSIALDLKVAADAQVLLDLVAKTDVFIENARPGVMERLGFGYRALSELRPDIIMVSMSAFGASGPYAGHVAYGATLETVGGIQSLTSYEETGPPQRIREMDVINGAAASGAVLTALMHRQRTGEGQHVDLSQLEASSHALVGQQFLEQVLTGGVTVGRGNRDERFAPQGCYACAGEDRWVTLTVRSETEWSGLCDALGRADLRSDARFASRADRAANEVELDALITAWTCGRTHHEAMEVLQQHGVPAAAVFDAKDLAEDPHLRSRDYFADNVEDSDKEFIGMPFQMSAGKASVWRRGPRLDQDSAYVRCDLLGHPADSVIPLRESDLGTAFDPVE